MIRFKILKKSKRSGARLGLIETSHGVVETPCLVPVATQAAVKALAIEDVEQTKSQLLICNTFHLHLKPGEDVVKKGGGLHEFMRWKKPLMTDSGGFQVFSLGFGKDFGLTKFLGRGADEQKIIDASRQPKGLRITDDGVFFRSFVNGDELFLGPKESIRIQEKLGADIIFTFDECTPPLANYEYVKKSLERTHRWLKTCIRVKKTDQALFGIVQGSQFKDLRQESAKFINTLEVDGFGIGGDLWRERHGTNKILDWFIPLLNERKPRHMLGVGYLKNIEDLIKAGVDTFDCTVPTHYARRGIAFTSEGKLTLGQSKYLKKHETLDKTCICRVCLNYTKAYLCHLARANELSLYSLLTFHNLHYFNTFAENLRMKIKEGEL